MTDTITLPRTTVQQALEALKHSVKLRDEDYDAMDALEAALEQPEQELKPLNGLTKEEALTWARGLRADSPEYCSCGDRPKNKCPGEWEPGCDLGNNPKYARRVELQCPAEQKESATITIQEAWEAAGGNPGIKATKEDLIFALQTLDQVCDEADQLAPYNGANEKPPVFGRRWRLAHDGFGLQLDDDGPYVHIADAISVLHTSLEQPEQEPVPLGLHPDTVRLAYLYNGTQTSSDALVDAEMKLINGETLTLEEARAAIDDAMSKPMKY
jgi:hypothetical protein